MEQFCSNSVYRLFFCILDYLREFYVYEEGNLLWKVCFLMFFGYGLLFFYSYMFFEIIYLSLQQ